MVSLLCAGCVAPTSVPKSNLLVNAAMQSSPHKNAAVRVFPGIGKEKNALTGWRVQYVSAATGITSQRVADAPPGFTHSLKIMVHHGAPLKTEDFLQLYQPIPYAVSSQLAFGTAQAKKLSAGFWIKSSIPGTFGFALNNARGTRNRTVPFDVKIPNMWRYISLPDITGDVSGNRVADGAGTGMFFQICMASGAKYQAEITGRWHDGDFLMQNGTTNATMLATNGATFNVTGATISN